MHRLEAGRRTGSEYPPEGGTLLPYAHTLRGTRYAFADLRTLLARASPLRSGDVLAGLAAASAAERVAAQMALADVPLAGLLAEPAVPY